MDYLVLDLETSVKNRGDEAIGKFHASPYHPDNQIVQCGFKHHECVNPTAYYNDDPDYAKEKGDRMKDMPCPETSTLLVGQNIAFDLGYLVRDFTEWDRWRDTGMIWDTMIVEYILSGQYDKFVNLDTLSEAVGGTLKDDRIKDYWKSGVDTEDIPYEELTEYMLHDVLNTEKVFLDQLDRADQQGMIPLIRAMMESRLATLEMEMNGMYMDRKVIVDEKAKVQDEIDLTTKSILAELAKSFPLDAHADLKVNSTSVIGCYLFGGVHTYKTYDALYDPDTGKPIVYKSGIQKGQIKKKWVEHDTHVVGKYNSKHFSNLGKSGRWATGEAVLNKISREYKDHRGDVVRAMLKLRGLMKDMSAYYVGYANLLWHDNILHPSFFHCSTDTGRLSCAQPNLQQCAGG